MKAAIYCRLSEEDRNKGGEEDSASIQNQKAMLTEYARDMGWEIHGIYSDDDYAGADRGRPEFCRLIADAEARKFSIVLCKTQSRFTRELELVEKYIHGLFPLWGIRFVSIVDNADTDNPGNKKSRQINGLVNEWYLEDMSENIKSVLTNRRKLGLHIGSFALYGYNKDPQRKGHLVIDEDAARVVRDVFEKYADGWGKTAIARYLNDKCVPNPTEYKRQNGLLYHSPKDKCGTLWKYPAISSMLTNEMYIGNMVSGRYGSVSYKTKENKPRPREEWYIVENTHEAIINRELWRRVQARIAERSKPCCTGEIGIFAGKVRCACCGYLLRSSKNRGRHYLSCSTRYAAKDACEGAFISVERLERAVLGEMISLNKIWIDTREMAKSIKWDEGITDEKKRLGDEIAAYKKKLSEYSAAMRELYLSKVRGVISEEVFETMSADFSAERGRLEAMAAECERQLGSITAQENCEHDRQSLPEGFLSPQHLTRNMVEALIDHITVGKRIDGGRDVPIRIYWNF